MNVNTSENFKVSFKSLGQLIRFGLKLSKKDFDLIHLQHVWDPYIHVVAWLARLKGIPYIITPRGMLEPWIMNRNRWKKQLAMFLYQRRDIRKAVVLHATCEMEKNNIRKLGFRNPIVVIPNGLNISEIKQKTGRPENQIKNILFLSRVHPKKGIELLIDAIAQLKPNNLKITIAGEGEPDYVESLKKQTNERGVSNLFDFVGGVYGNQKWELYQQAELFVLPTYSENFGIVIAEALATGIPVITTTGTPWHELHTERCGWWIELSVENLTYALNEAIHTKPEQLKEMGIRGRKLVEEKYDIKGVGKNIIDLYYRIRKNE